MKDFLSSLKLKFDIPHCPIKYKLHKTTGGKATTLVGCFCLQFIHRVHGMNAVDHYKLQTLQNLKIMNTHAFICLDVFMRMMHACPTSFLLTIGVVL